MYRRILVPLDGSEASESVLPHVADIARGCGAEQVILYRVCEPAVILADYPPNLRVEWEDHVKQETAHIQEQCRLNLNDAASKLTDLGINVMLEAGLGNAADQILDYAAQHQVDLIVMASHGHSGVTRWAFGNTANKVLQSSSVPVLLVKPRSPIRS